jgi:cob(I)alamin adenosyltransferase
MFCNSKRIFILEDQVDWLSEKLRAKTKQINELEQRIDALAKQFNDVRDILVIAGNHLTNVTAPDRVLVRSVLTDRDYSTISVG